MRKVVCWFMLAGLSMTGTQAQTYHYDLRHVAVEQRDFVDTIPLIIKNNRLYVEAMVGGHPCQFLLDTGSGLGMIGLNSGIKPVCELGTLPTSIDFNGNKRAETIVELPELKLGKTTIRHYPIILSPRQGRWDNALGFALINKGLIAKIDTRHKQLVLTDKKKLFDSELGYAVKYKLLQNVPYVDIEPFAGIHEWSLLDTGNPGLFNPGHLRLMQMSKQNPAVQAQVEWQTRGITPQGVNGADEEYPVAFLHLNRILWGDYQFEDIRTTTKPGDSNLGVGLLNHGALIINPFRKRVIFQPYSAETKTTIGNRHRNIRLVPATDGRALIGLIWRDCEGYQKGIRQGDIILKVNNQDIPSLAAFLSYPFLRGQSYTYILYNPRHHFTYEVKMGPMGQE